MMLMIMKKIGGAGTGSQWGSGGMAGKVEAALLGAFQGVTVVITKAEESENNRTNV